METESGAEFISEAHVRHIMRYVQARDWLSDRPRGILDAACGTGYGSRILDKAGHQVMGVDFNQEALTEARSFGGIFTEIDFMSDTFPLFCLAAKTGAVVSIETLEHFNKKDGLILLERFNTALLLKGILIVSTPYCEHSGPSPITKQHLWEYSLSDFEQALHESGFAIEQMKIDRHDGQFGRRGYCMAKAIKR